jgi:hypothetical protein
MADETIIRRDFRELDPGLGASQAAGVGTTGITFDSDPVLPTLGASEIIKLIIGNEIEYLTTYTAASLTGTVVRAREGTSAVAHADNAPVIVGPTKRDLSNGRLTVVSRASTDLTPNSTSWADLDTGLDLALAWAFEHDVIEIGMSARPISGTANLYLDVVTRPAGANVNSCGLTPFGGTVVAAPAGITLAEGVPAWTCPAANTSPRGGSVFYRLAATDIDGATATVLRFRYRTDIASARTLRANANAPLQVWVKNHGQQESRTI